MPIGNRTRSIFLGAQLRRLPGNRGGPLMHIIAAKAAEFGEALESSFRDYAARVIANPRALAATLQVSAAC